MGKTFRKDSGHNKFARRDPVAKKKFSEKFLKPAKQKTKTELLPVDTIYPENA